MHYHNYSSVRVFDVARPALANRLEVRPGPHFRGEVIGLDKRP